MEDAAQSVVRDAWIDFADRTIGELKEVGEKRLMGRTEPRIVASVPHLIAFDIQALAQRQTESSRDFRFFEALARLLEYPAVSGGTSWLSAETSSLYAEGDHSPPHPATGDHVVLIASDSDEGCKAAELVARILTGVVGGGVAVLGTESVDGSVELADLVSHPGSTVVRVADLKVDDGTLIPSSAEALAEVLAMAFIAASRTSSELILHLLGGFKATIPIMTALAAHLPIDRDVKIELWSNHERTTHGIKLPLLRIGVPDEEYWDLQRLSAGPIDRQETDSMRTARWYGYAWDESEGEVGLTYLGRALLRMLALTRKD